MDDAQDNGEANEPTYAYKPSLIGAPWEFRLSPSALEWRMERNSGSVAYGEIMKVHLSFRAASMQGRRFLAEIWPKAGPKLTIGSASWKSMLEQEEKNAAYSDFMHALHRRIGASGDHAVFTTGMNAMRYWPGVVVFALVSLTTALLLLAALIAATFAAAAFFACFLAAFVWQLGDYFRRNRPRHYTADAIPPDLLPKF